ncbi:MAG: hypothetical protein JSR72_01615 [Proteobacteria bacterium]|nr:hypothetical protein [Pseudomonadota bacterium]
MQPVASFAAGTHIVFAHKAGFDGKFAQHFWSLFADDLTWRPPEILANTRLLSMKPACEPLFSDRKR